MSYVTKNYEDQGGDRSVIGGEINVLPGGKITANGIQASALASPTDLPTALATIVALISALKGVGITA